MSENKKVMEYDEDESVKFIRESLPEDLSANLSDDEINYVVDLIYEFYEEKGLFDETEDSEIEINEDELISYAIGHARKDKVKDFSDEEIGLIIAGELAYCDSLDLFD